MAVTEDISKFQTLHPSRKLAVVIIIAFVFLGSIYLGSMFARNYLKSPATPVTGEPTTAKTNLKLVSDITSVPVGSQFIVRLELDTVPVTVSDIRLNFDPKLLSVTGVTAGPAFSSLIVPATIDNTKGVVTFSLSVDPNDPTTLAIGHAASIDFTAKSAGRATISFDKEFTNTAKSGQYTQGTMSDLKITVQ